MADDRKEFDDLGEEVVRKRLSTSLWDEDKQRSARQWLRETSLAREANDLARTANDVAEKANKLARTNNTIAIVALVGAMIAIAISIISLVLKSHLGLGLDQL
jgi:hypothetical protein